MPAAIKGLRLAEIAGLSPTPCRLRLRKLEQSGIIAGHHARIAPRRVVSFATVPVEMTLPNHRQADFDHFERAVAALEEVTACRGHERRSRRDAQ